MWLDMYEDQFTLQQEEIDDVCWMDLEDCIRGVKTCSFENCIEMEELLMVQKTAGRRFIDERKQ